MLENIVLKLGLPCFSMAIGLPLDVSEKEILTIERNVMQF